MEENKKIIKTYKEKLDLLKNITSIIIVRINLELQMLNMIILKKKF